MQVTLLHFSGCPHWRTVDAHLRALAEEIPGLSISLRAVETPEDAERLGFRGSPSLLIDGVDPFAAPGAPAGLACRMYATPEGPAGSPTRDQIREALLHA